MFQSQLLPKSSYDKKCLSAARPCPGEGRGLPGVIGDPHAETSGTVLAPLAVTGQKVLAATLKIDSLSIYLKVSSNWWII